MTEKELKFAKDLGKCAGMWVATDDDRFVACGNTIKEARQKAHDAEVENPVIFQVPAAEDGHCFF